MAQGVNDFLIESFLDNPRVECEIPIILFWDNNRLFVLLTIQSTIIPNT